MIEITKESESVLQARTPEIPSYSGKVTDISIDNVQQLSDA